MLKLKWNYSIFPEIWSREAESESGVGVRSRSEESVSGVGVSSRCQESESWGRRFSGGV